MEKNCNSSQPLGYEETIIQVYNGIDFVVSLPNAQCKFLASL